MIRKNFWRSSTKVLVDNSRSVYKQIFLITISLFVISFSFKVNDETTSDFVFSSREFQTLFTFSFNLLSQPNAAFIRFIVTLKILYCSPEQLKKHCIVVLQRKTRRVGELFSLHLSHLIFTYVQKVTQELTIYRWLSIIFSLFSLTPKPVWKITKKEDFWHFQFIFYRPSTFNYTLPTFF